MAFENQRVMHYWELVIPSSDISSMAKEEVAFLATLAFAINEISVFEKLIIHTTGGQPNDGDLKVMYQIQQNTITRILSAKIFEALKVFKDGEIILRRSGDVKSADELAKFMAEFENLKNGKSYDLAKIIRNSTTNHYLVSETVKNIQHGPDEIKIQAMLHKNQGNSFYPFGEEHVFYGRICRHFKEKYDQDISLEDIDEWIRWCLKASSLLSRMFSSYLTWLHIERFPDWVLRKKTPYLELNLFSDIGDFVLPICFSTDAYEEKKD